MTVLKDRHRVALARELAFAAGVPLRDGYGFAASDDTVLAVVNAVFATSADECVVAAIGVGNVSGNIELAMPSGTSTDPDYARRIVAALRPLADRNHDAA